MSRVLPVALVLFGAVLSAVVAAPLEDEDRVLRVSAGLADLDRDTAFGLDLESADGPSLDVSIGWMRSRVFELGLQLAYLDLEVDDSAPDAGASLSGPLYGGFLAMHIPTESSVSPYFVAGVTVPGGDFKSAYEFSYGVGFGVDVLTGERWGFGTRLEFVVLNGDFDIGDSGVPGQDFAPDGNLVRLTAGFVRRY